MHKLWVVLKNELYRYFISPLAYVYLITFLLLNGSCAIYFGDFFNRGQADLSSMFAFQPWIYLIFIPGISMRLWAEEFRHRTIVQILTLPVSTATYVWGKFLAAWLFCGLALILTFPFWITVNILGTPDNGVILGSYLGSFLLAGCMLAISQTMSALTKNQVIALVLSVITNLLFFLSGLEFVLSFFRGFAPYPVIEMIASFSFLTHFDTLMHGLLEFRDLFFFGSLILLFNTCAILIINFKTSGVSAWFKSTSRSYYILVFILLLCGFAGLNLTANNTLRNIQYDFTADKLYTLSPSTQNILKNLSYPVTAKLYYTPILGQRNPQIRLLADKLHILLQKYHQLSDEKFNFVVYHPELLDDKENQAIAAELQPIPLIDLNQNGYLGMVLTDETGNSLTIPMFALERQDFLEQDLTTKLLELSHKKPTVGIISTLPVFEEVNSQTGNMVTPKWEIINQIEELYTIKEIKTAEDFTPDIQVLLLIHPHDLKPEIIESIVNYSNHGGNSLVLLDATAEAPRIFSPENNAYISSDLGELSRIWHFNYFPQAIVADLDNSITVDATSNYQKNPNFTQDIIQFSPHGNDLNREQPETAKLKSLLFASSSILRPDSDKAVDFIPLIKASKNSAMMPTSVVHRGMNPADILRWFKPDTQDKVIAAKIISKDSQHPFEIIAVADTDFIYDSFWTQSSSVLDRKYIIPVLDNGNFILNALESLSNQNNLIDLRGKTSSDRRFADIEKMRKDNQLQFKLKEAEILSQIDETKDKLSEVWNKKDFEGREVFSADELAVIANYRQKLDVLRRELASIRQNMNNNIQQIALQIKLINIYLIPALLLTGMLLRLLWLRRTRPIFSAKLHLNKTFAIVAGICLLLLGIGVISTYLNNQSPVSAYEDKPVFPNLAQEINRITEIRLTTNQSSLKFVLEKNLWRLDGHPDFPVYQERIRRFLNTLLEARFYEKRTASPEYLHKFGLSPLEVASSPTTEISLFDEKGKDIIRFDVGDYNIDIGRGTQGAYIKFPNQFQVWLIKGDFIDLSAEWQDWTYSSLWNLRFGRIADTNIIHNPEQMTLLVRDMLTTPLLKAYQKVDTSAPYQTLDILTEDHNQLRLQFYKNKDRYFVKYLFDNSINGKHLQFFADYAKARFYEIPSADMEKIKNALTAEKTQANK